MAKPIPRAGRDEFARDLMARLRPLEGIERVTVRYYEENEYGLLVQQPADRACVLVAINGAGMKAEVMGAVSRFQQVWDFDLEVMPLTALAIVWDDKHRPTRQTIWSAGRSVAEALEELRKAQRWGELADVKASPGDADEVARGYTWSARFTAGGTSMKAAGWHRTAFDEATRAAGDLYAVTWWK